VRVAQLRLREAASAALARPLGQDELIPLMEHLLVLARPRAAHSIARHLGAIGADDLLRRPDLASAVDGWALACEGVEARALEAWRTALKASAFYRALARSPPPNVLIIATVPPNLTLPLPSVFGSFFEQLEADEAEVWPAAASTDEHAEAVQRLVNDMLPTGEALHVGYAL
jgi:hypothetical protein